MGGGEPRATKDLDLVVAADATKYDALVAGLARRGFHPATSVGGGDHPVPDLVLYRDARGRRIDILFAHTDFEVSALARRSLGEPYAGVVVPVVSVEDLLVYKLLADRAQDRADLEHVVRARVRAGAPIDWPYVEAWCRRLRASTSP